MSDQVTTAIETTVESTDSTETDRSPFEIDRLCADASEIVIEDLLRTEYGDEETEMMDDVSRLLLTIRDLERVADPAVNICARTVYMTDHDTELIY